MRKKGFNTHYPRETKTLQRKEVKKNDVLTIMTEGGGSETLFQTLQTQKSTVKKHN